MSVDQAIKHLRGKMAVSEDWGGTYMPFRSYVEDHDFCALHEEIARLGWYSILVINEDPGVEERKHWMIVGDSFFRGKK